VDQRAARIIVEGRGGIGWILLDHPPLNVITTSMARDMRLAVEHFDADPDTRVIVLAAAGERAFAAGADVGEHTLDLVRELNDEIFALARCLLRADGKPRIAAVKGICSGGANEVAFACDFVVAREDARFALPEIGIGAVNSLGALLMARFMSRGKAVELAFSGEWLDAARARDVGLVAELLPREGFESALEQYLRRFTGKSGAALRLGRHQLRTLFEPELDATLTSLSRRLMDESVALEDYHEGVAAFLEKRKPVWRHR
jgi:enoyl-CoA hydratase/carnithine racemase